MAARCGRHGGAATAPAPRRGRHGGVTCAALIAALLAGACDGVEPVPSPAPPASPSPAAGTPDRGIGVGVVLPAPAEMGAAEADRLRDSLLGLERQLRGTVREMRVARPDAPVFRRDLAELLAAGGSDLVCVLGGEAVRTIVVVAGRFPAVRFCAVPGRIGPSAPPNTIAVDVRAEEAGYLAGAAAGFLAGDARVALVGLRGDPLVGRLRAGFQAGLSQLRPGAAAPIVTLVGGDPTDEATAGAVRAAAAEAFAAGAQVVYAPAGAAAVGAARAAAAPLEPGAEASPGEPSPTPLPPPVTRGAAVIADGGILAAELPEELAGTLVAVIALDLAAGVGAAAARVAAGEEVTALDVGLTAGAVDTVPGAHPQAAAVAEVLVQVREAIAAGAVTVPAPA